VIAVEGLVLAGEHVERLRSVAVDVHRWAEAGRLVGLEERQHVVRVPPIFTVLAAGIRLVSARPFFNHFSQEEPR
jgi:hypothetical protein